MKLHDVFSEIPTIKTERYVLREIVTSDANDLFDYYNNDQVTQFLDWYGPRSEEHAMDVIKHWKRGFEEGWIIRWAIATREDNKIIGTIFYNGFRDGQVCEVGYELSQTYWRKGVMTEVFKHLLPIAFEQLGINRIQATVDPLNSASIGLLKKIGFQEEGLLRDYEVHGVTGLAKDMFMFSLLKREYTR